MPYVTRLNAASRSNVFDTRQATNWAWPSLMAPTAWSSLALVQAYPSQLGWLMSGISAEALWRRWALDADGEPFERELAIRGDIDDAPGVGGYGSPRDTA